MLNKTCFGKGLLKVNIRAMNAFSASDVDVNLEKILQICQNYSDHSLDEYGNTVSRGSNNDLSLNSKNVQVFTCLFYSTMIVFLF